ncbi:Coenzyme F420 hydrogenase/dehydrogenase, beta subunit C-terminal domain [Xylanibacter rodentium]|uniref:Coenzyme F420 hydrogenase/dehydrogenase, beta subunit C-terminal domain n=1 Tax=Xylanibacter rodentium TaxID=2736289 RepID=UPI002557F59D|nr:Coenzyme F420 hydrogenase/dehydrogenase, beta subunit C-terminal domain [Xylanibacter rodentium]
MPIIIKDKKMCCGCTACQQICPKNCIEMVRDNEGFLYPKINRNNCIYCGLCERACPEISPFDIVSPIDCYAAKSSDETIRKESSSGGMFTLIAEYVLSQNGVVFGARFDENWQVVMDYTENKDGLKKFRGSKYVQCSIGDSYAQARDFLKSGRKVLYTGSSCQIAGLRRYLGHNYDNLLLVDYLCHGAPSPFLWEKYLEEISQHNVSSLTNISFRSKKRGWKNYGIVIEVGKHIIVDSAFFNNIYMKAFLSDMSLRPSCYHCLARNGRSGSDLTIGDHWAIRNINTLFDDDDGVSLVLLNTDKGYKTFKRINTESIQTDFEKSKKYNGAFYKATEEHLHRKRFFRKLQYRDDVCSLINEELEITMFDHIQKNVKKLLDLIVK